MRSGSSVRVRSEAPSAAAKPRFTHRILLTSLLVIAAVAGTGCGTQGCKTEKAPLPELPTCLTPIKPGGQVSVSVRVVEKCYQYSPLCKVRADGDTLTLETTVESCLDASGCTLPARSIPGPSCFFWAPSTPGPYAVQVFDPDNPDAPKSFTLTVSTGGALRASCF